MTPRSHTLAFVRPPSKGGILKKLLILGVIGVVLLIGGVAILVPVFAGNLLIPRIEAAAAKSIDGTVRIDSISLSWTGQQSAKSVELLDPDGTIVAHADLTVQRSLFQLLSSSSNLGTVSMTGYVEVDRPKEGAPTNLERAVASRQSAAVAQASTKAIKLPAFKMNLDMTGLRLSYRLGGELIGIDQLSITGPLNLSGTTDLQVSAVPTLDGKPSAGRSISGSIRSDALRNAAGELAIDGSNLEVSLDADLPAEYAEIAASMLSENRSVSPIGNAPLAVRIAIREDGGRLVSSSGAEAVSVSGPIPPSLIAMLAPQGAVSVDQSGGFTLRATRFDLPVTLMTQGIGSADLRRSALLLAVTTDAVDADFTPEGGEATRLRLEPIDLRFGSENFAQVAFAEGDLRAFVGETPAGTVLLDASINGLLAADGTLASLDRIRPSGQLRLIDVPASLLDPIASNIEQFGEGFVREVFGQNLSATFTAEARADLGSADNALESPSLGLELTSARTTVRAAAVLDSDRIVAPGEAFTIESSAGRKILSRLAPQLLDAMEPSDTQTIRLTASANDVLVIQGVHGPVDLERLKASLRISIDRDRSMAEGLDRMVLSVEAPGDGPVQLDAVATGRGNAEPFNLSADISLSGLQALLEADDLLLAEGVRTDGAITLTGVPLRTVEQLAGMESGTLASLAGDRLDGRVQLVSGAGSNSTTITLRTPVAQVDAGFRLQGRMLSSTMPTTISSREPQRMLDGFVPSGIVIDGEPVLRIGAPRNLIATVERIDLDVTGLGAPRSIAAGIGEVQINAPGLELLGQSGERLTYSSFEARVIPSADALQLRVTGSSDGRPTLSILSSIELQQLLDGAEPFALAERSLPATIASAEFPAWLIGAFALEQKALFDAATGASPVKVSIAQAAQTSAVTVETDGMRIETTARIGSQQISIGSSRANVTATPEHVAAILAALNAEGDSSPYGLASPTVVNVRIEPLNIPLGENSTFDLRNLRAQANLQGDAVITGVLDRDGIMRNLGVRAANATVAFGAGGTTIEVNARAFDPIASAEMGTLTARLEPGGRFDVRFADGQTRSLDTWLTGEAATNGPFALTFGNSLALSARSRDVASLPEGTDRIEIGVASPRITTQLLADRSEQRIALAEPFQVALTVAPALFTELIAPLIADDTGSELKLRESARAALAIRSLTIDKRDGSLDLANARIDAEFAMVNANFDALLGENPTTRVERAVELGKIQGSIRRADGTNEPIRFGLTSMDDETDETRFTVDGTLQTDGVAPVLSATAQGDIPTALVDVLAGQRGLLVDAIGDSVRVQASADGIDADRTYGRLTASIQALRAEAAAFGSFENGALLLGDGAASRTNITLSEITPELSRRVLEPLFPLLRDFQKSRSEQPTIITVTSAGLAIPTDGDLSKLTGNINLNLGSVRFEAGELLSTVLSATANRTSGQLGQSLPPVLVKFNKGVATYDRIEIPFGEFTLRTRGTIDLVNQQMDIIVLLPLDFIGGDLKRAAERNPIIAQIAAVPMRARGPIGSAKLELDPSAIQDILPGAIEGQLNDLINQGLRDLFRR